MTPFLSQAESELGAPYRFRKPAPLESLRIAWLIFWRSSLIGAIALVLVVPVFRIGLTGILVTLGATQMNDIVMWALMFIMQPLVILPIVLTMLIGKQFRGFDVIVERADGNAPDISFRDALAPAWLLYWRVSLLAGVPLILLGAALNHMGARPIMSGALGVMLALGAYMIAYWIVVSMMFRKRFKLFGFRVRRSGEIGDRKL